MNVGLIGLGDWGRRVYNEYAKLDSEGKLSLVGICDVDHTKFPFNTPYKTTDYHELLRHVDAVHICAPNALHYRITRDALSAGKSVLVEKPITLSSVEAENLIRLAEGEGLILAVGHIHRFNAAVKELCELIKAKTLREVTNIDMQWTNYYQPPPDTDILWDPGPASTRHLSHAHRIPTNPFHISPMQ